MEKNTFLTPLRDVIYECSPIWNNQLFDPCLKQSSRGQDVQSGEVCCWEVATGRHGSDVRHGDSQEGLEIADSNGKVAFIKGDF